VFIACTHEKQGRDAYLKVSLKKANPRVEPSAPSLALTAMQVLLRLVTILLVVCFVEGKLFGFTQQNKGKLSVAFSTINEVTGSITLDPVEVHYDQLAQGLSAFDMAHGIAYVVGYNLTDHKPHLVGLDTKSGKVAVELALPFTEAGQVGLGQAIDVDPTTGDVIAIGQASGATGGTLGHHFVIRVDFKTKAIMTVANISKDVPSKAVVNGLGGGNTLDYTRNVEYVNMAVDQSGQTIAVTVRIDLKTGATTIAGKPNGEILWGLHFDAKSDRIFGFGPSIAPPPTGTVVSSPKRPPTVAALQTALAAKPIHTLAYLNAADGASTPLKIIGGIPGYFLLEGAVVTVDPIARRFYTLLQPAQNIPSWVPSTDCAKGPFPCATGTTCCEDPASKSKAGACYKVTDCGNIHDGGGVNTSLPFQLVGVDLATAAVTTHPDLCTMKAGDCPDGLDASDALE
jgi:hypothetical protein